MAVCVSTCACVGVSVCASRSPTARLRAPRLGAAAHEARLSAPLLSGELPLDSVVRRQLPPLHAALAALRTAVLPSYGAE